MGEDFRLRLSEEPIKLELMTVGPTAKLNKKQWRYDKILEKIYENKKTLENVHKNHGNESLISEMRTYIFSL